MSCHRLKSEKGTELFPEREGGGIRFKTKKPEPVYIVLFPLGRPLYNDRYTDLEQLLVLGVVVEIAQITLDAETGEPLAGDRVVVRRRGGVRVARAVFRLLDSPRGPLGRAPRERRRRGRVVVVAVVGRDEAHAVRVGRLLVAVVVVVVVHQNALARRVVVARRRRRGVVGRSSRLGRRHRARTTAARRRHGLAIVIGRHVNGQHVRLHTEKPKRPKVIIEIIVNSVGQRYSNSFDLQLFRPLATFRSLYHRK